MPGGSLPAPCLLFLLFSCEGVRVQVPSPAVQLLLALTEAVGLSSEGSIGKAQVRAQWVVLWNIVSVISLPVFL